MDEQKLTPAEKHYQALRKAQKKYYEKKQNERAEAEGRERRPRGRPRGVVQEGV